MKRFAVILSASFTVLGSSAYAVPDDCRCPDGQRYDEVAGQCVTSDPSNPAACYAHPAPVCGCDGVTYVNQCEAGKAGVKHWSEGECGVSPGATF